MIHKTAVVGPFQCNCRLLVCPRTAHAALIDPGDDSPKIFRLIEQAEKELGKPIELKYLLHTHGHLDHIAATRAVREKAKQARIYLHKDDEELYQNLPMQARMFGLNYGEPLAVDSYFEDEMDLRVGDLKISLIHTPGHSPGSVSLRLHEATDVGSRESLFSGDTLFQGSVGRTDLWGGDEELMFRSIRQRLFTLDDETLLCPGHGPESSIGIEKRENPFFR